MWWERKPQGERQKESPSSPPQREAETLEVGQVAYGKLDAPYQDQWELMEDAFALIDYRLYLYYKYHQWLGPQGDMRNMLGLVVSREEFEHNLTKAAQTGLMEKLAPEELEQIRVGEAVLERRLALTAPDAFPLLKVFQRFGLDPFSRWVLTLCYGARLDTKYERLLAYLQDDITKKTLPSSWRCSYICPRGNRWKPIPPPLPGRVCSIPCSSGRACWREICS